MYWRKYVPVAQRREKANKKMNKMVKSGTAIQPVQLDGRTIARSFWGKGWCDHLDTFSDYENRLPRGRTYVRNGSVCHLDIQQGCIEAMVIGSELYHVKIEIKELNKTAWTAIQEKCAGQIGSMLELLQGRLSSHVMAIVTDTENGLFPQEGEIKLKCSCPDWAVMCKHVAAVLYGVGSRLDNQPELLFLLRGVDPAELITEGLALPTATDAGAADALEESQLGDIFGIDLDMEASETPPSPATNTKTVHAKATPITKAKTKAKAKTNGKKSVPATLKSDARVKTPSKAATEKTETKTDAPWTGQSIAALRKKLKLTVLEFAEKLSVSAASVSRWESIDGPLKLQLGSANALLRLSRSAKTRK